jgi:hypothetical protein
MAVMAAVPTSTRVSAAAITAVDRREAGLRGAGLP